MRTKLFHKNPFVAHGLLRRMIALFCLAIGVFVAKTMEPEPHSALVVKPAQGVPAGFGMNVYRFDPSDGRRLSEYDLGGEVETCGWQSDGEVKECWKKRDEARKFIYDHWQSKTRAYIAVDFPCTDCGPTEHIFIEPNADGVWRISRVMEEPRFPVRYWGDAFDVKFRKARDEDRPSERTARLLSFLDSSGAEIDSF